MTRQDTGVPIIGVPSPDNGDDLDRQAFMAAMSTPIAHVLADPAEVWRTHGVSSHPSMVFVAADGTTTSHPGTLGPQELLGRIEALERT